MNLTLLRAEWRAVRRAAMRLAQQSLSMVGLAAVGVGAVVATHPDYAAKVGRLFVADARPQQPVVDPLPAALASSGSEASRLLGLTVSDREQPAPGTARPAATRESKHEKQEAVAYLARKYRVNADAVAMLVDAAYATGRDLDIDPLLLLSVMGVESGFNPFAQSTAGASGLMQLMSKVHADKLAGFGGPNIALNPIVNLKVGAVVLKDCIRRGGSIADGLRLYVGAGTGDDAGYGAHVLQEKDRLAQAVRGIVRPRIEPIPSTAAKLRPRQPEVDHSFDNGEPAEPKVDADAGRVAAL